MKLRHVLAVRIRVESHTLPFITTASEDYTDGVTNDVLECGTATIKCRVTVFGALTICIRTPRTG